MLLATLETACSITESVHVHSRQRKLSVKLSSNTIPFRDREKRSSEVIPLGMDTQSHCTVDCVRTPESFHEEWSRLLLITTVMDLAPLVENPIT